MDVSKINMAGYDTLGACIFAGFGFAAAPETVSALVNARYGNSFEKDLLKILGREKIALRGNLIEGRDLPRLMTAYRNG